MPAPSWYPDNFAFEPGLLLRDKTDRACRVIESSSRNQATVHVYRGYDAKRWWLNRKSVSVDIADDISRLILEKQIKTQISVLTSKGILAEGTSLNISEDTNHVSLSITSGGKHIFDASVGHRYHGRNLWEALYMLHNYKR